MARKPKCCPSQATKLRGGAVFKDQLKLKNESKISDIVDSTTYSIFEDVTSTAAAVTLALFDKIEVLGFHALKLTKSKSISP